MSDLPDDVRFRSTHWLNPELMRMQSDHWLIFSSGISINPITGEVKIPDGLSLDDASRSFWESVKRLGPKEMRE